MIPSGSIRGKSITLLMGTGPGASYDMYGRTIAEHLGKHIPGRPSGRRQYVWCDTSVDLDLPTLVWTRGEAFPLSLLASRLKCPSCGLMKVRVYFRIREVLRLNNFTTINHKAQSCSIVKHFL